MIKSNINVMVIEIKSYKSKDTWWQKIIFERNHIWFKTSDTWKIQLTITITFISSKDTDEECIAYSKSDNMEIMIYDKADKVIT